MTEKRGIFRELWERRVFQITGLYLGGGWAVLEFISGFVVEQLGFSPQLTIQAFLAIMSLLPSTLMIAWFHGRPGPDRWHSIEKVGIPVNLILTVFLLFWTGRARPLEAGGDAVAGRAVSGTSVQEAEQVAVDPKTRLALMNFSTEDSEEDIEWLEKGLPKLLDLTLGQDIRFSLRVQSAFRRDLEERGLGVETELPLTLARELCEANSYEHFIRGSVGLKNGEYSIDCRLYRTRDLQAVGERSISGPDLPALLDTLNRCISGQLLPPDEDRLSIPAAELISHDAAAIREYCRGLELRIDHNDMAAAMEHLEAARRIDADFTYATFELFILFNRSNMQEAAQAELQTLLDNLYSLPEQDRYYIRYWSFMMENDLDRAVAILDVWKERFRRDTRPHLLMAYNHHRNRGQLRQAIDEYRRILELDPGADEHLLDIADLQSRLDRPEEARDSYGMYLEKHPQQLRPLQALAVLETRIGNFQAAVEMYSRILLLDPKNVQAMQGRAVIHTHNGEFEEAMAVLARALDASDTARDSMETLRSISYLHYFQADMISSLRYKVLSDELASKVQNPMQMLVDKLDDIDLFLKMGEVQVASDIAVELKNLSAPLDELYLAGELDIQMYLRDRAGIAMSLLDIDRSHLDRLMGLRVDILHQQAEAMMHEIDGEYRQAADLLAEAIEILPEFEEALVIPLARNQRLAGDTEGAEETLKRLMRRIPAHGEMHLEFAQLRWQQERHSEALDHLNISMEIWKNAHPAYEQARTAAGLMRQYKIMGTPLGLRQETVRQSP